MTGDYVCRSGIIYVLFAFNSWLSPSFVVVFGPRVSMLVAALLYVFYVSQYLYLNTYSVYVATVLVGLAAPVIWTAQVEIFSPKFTLYISAMSAGISTGQQF